MEQEPTIQICSVEHYQSILLQKKEAYSYHELDTKIYDAMLKCFNNQLDYLKLGLFKPLILFLEDNQNIILQICPENFIDNEQKKQFIREVTFLRKLEINFSNLNFYNFDSHINESEQNEEHLVWMPIFIQQKKKTS